ncbi:cytidine deaminase [Sphingomonas sp.]|uniref:cytidine deaminase n=1 Tax=Sphingomonas sp. TaxID=28214 RepID=UPI001D3265CB|nr:cytidine deaminase [Sphingomonas sp.]MBX9796191.1 cytidine deaminase [Sphingomonas sp.]
MNDALSQADAELVAAARAAAGRAYAPYSRFAVGAALRLSDGSIVIGANVENASYGLSLCAETVAVASASVQGRLADIVAVAVAGGPMAGDAPGGDAPVMPCGRCRQILNEAASLGGRDLPVLCTGAAGGAVARLTLSHLLPHAFGPASLA